MLAVAARTLARIPYELPPQELDRMPTRPRSGVVLAVPATTATPAATGA